jgi:hypothetical protein
MRAETRLKRILSLPDGENKRLKLINFCLFVAPNSSIQLKAKEELEKLSSRVVKPDHNVTEYTRVLSINNYEVKPKSRFKF